MAFLVSFFQKAWWEQEDKDVLFLSDASFKPSLRRIKHALVMFYSPLCRCCKHTRPEFVAAAGALKSNPSVVFAAIDCTRYGHICAAYKVEHYPTIRYFSYLRNTSEYVGVRRRGEFIEYMSKRQM